MICMPIESVVDMQRVTEESQHRPCKLSALDGHGLHQCEGGWRQMGTCDNKAENHEEQARDTRAGDCEREDKGIGKSNKPGS